MGTPLAIKVLDPNLAKRPDYVSRFKREASAAAALRSPHVVQIFDFGIWGDIPYIAMELLEGEDLGSRLDRTRRLPAQTVSAIVTQVSRALVRAHKRGIVHRDMKPDNIYLCIDDDGEAEVVKILDFGVAKAVGGISLARTGTGVVLGTPYYMSPEQAQGEKRIDHRTDLWALGVITFEAIVGRRPFEATNLGDLLVKICGTVPPAPSTLFPNVPDGFDEWFLRACAKNPEDRFFSAKEMAATLAILCGALPSALSDSSYVTLFPPRASPDGPRASNGPMSSTLGENEPTQVMTELPDGVRAELEDRIRPPVPGVAEKEASEPSKRSETSKPANQDTSRIRSRSPIPAPPVLRERPVSFTPPRDVEDDDDDSVEMFDAATVAAGMAEIRRQQHADKVRARRREFFAKSKWTIAAILLLAVAAITAAVTVLSR
jgi:serine/threonine-protein kinase